MKKLLIAAGIILCFAAAGLSGSLPARAQTGGSLPPTIISFTSDLASITLGDAEAGQTTARLSWNVVGLAAQHRLVLYAYEVRSWVTLAGDSADPLPASGSFEVLVRHPLNFGPPTYNLAILDTQGQVLDQRVLSIAYDAESGTDAPDIISASSTQTSVDAGALANGTARVPVMWELTNRPPDSNLVFEQVLEGGRIVPVELARPNLWIPSVGEGVVAPVLPGSGQPVRLQVRLVGMADGATLAQAQLEPIGVTAATVPPPALTPVPGQPGPRIDYFIAAPEVIERGGTVTLSWQVSGASRVSVWRLEPGGPIAEEAPVTTPTGSWTVTVPTSYVDFASFTLNVVDSAGNLAIQGGVTVEIICPYVYFFGDPGVQVTSSCPYSSAVTVQAAYQSFEGGFMVWRGDTSEIIVFFNGGQISRFRDTWQGETVSVPEAPPEGLFQPVRGFGTVWVENPQVRGALGWATGLEQGYTMQYQQSGEYKYARLFLTLPDGRIIFTIESSWGYR